MDVKGKPFDPNFHEAVSYEDIEDESLDNTVTAELQAGYLLHEKVIRYAKVKVGRKEEK